MDAIVANRPALALLRGKRTPEALAAWTKVFAEGDAELSAKYARAVDALLGAGESGDWGRFVARLSPATRLAYAANITEFFEWIARDRGQVVPPHRVTTGDVQRYAEWLASPTFTLAPEKLRDGDHELRLAMYQIVEQLGDASLDAIWDLLPADMRALIPVPDTLGLEDRVAWQKLQIGTELGRMVLHDTLVRAPTMAALRQTYPRAGIDQFQLVVPRTGADGQKHNVLVALRDVFTYAVPKPHAASRTTIAAKLSALSAWWGVLQRGENVDGGEPVLKHNIVRPVLERVTRQLSQVRKTAAAKQRMDPQLIPRLFAAANETTSLTDKRDKALLFFLVFTGARVTEAVSLRRGAPPSRESQTWPGWLDDAAEPPVIWLRRKGGELARLPMPPFAMKAVAEFQAALTEAAATGAAQSVDPDAPDYISSDSPEWRYRELHYPDAPLFPPAALWGANAPGNYKAMKPNPKLPYTRSLTRHGASAALKRIARRAGLTAAEQRSIHPHAIRHFVAQAMAAEGKDLRQIQAILGHGSITTTEGYLTEVTSDVALSGQAEILAFMGKMVQGSATDVPEAPIQATSTPVVDAVGFEVPADAPAVAAPAQPAPAAPRPKAKPTRPQAPAEPAAVPEPVFPEPVAVAAELSPQQLIDGLIDQGLLELTTPSSRSHLVGAFTTFLEEKDPNIVQVSDWLEEADGVAEVFWDDPKESDQLLEAMPGMRALPARPVADPELAARGVVRGRRRLVVEAEELPPNSLPLAPAVDEPEHLVSAQVEYVEPGSPEDDSLTSVCGDDADPPQELEVDKGLLRLFDKEVSPACPIWVYEGLEENPPDPEPTEFTFLRSRAQQKTSPGRTITVKDGKEMVQSYSKPRGNKPGHAFLHDNYDPWPDNYGIGKVSLLPWFAKGTASNDGVVTGQDPITDERIEIPPLPVLGPDQIYPESEASTVLDGIDKLYQLWLQGDPEQGIAPSPSSTYGIVRWWSFFATTTGRLEKFLNANNTLLRPRPKWEPFNRRIDLGNLRTHDDAWIVAWFAQNAHTYTNAVRFFKAIPKGRGEHSENFFSAFDRASVESMTFVENLPEWLLEPDPVNAIYKADPKEWRAFEKWIASVTGQKLSPARKKARSEAEEEAEAELTSRREAASGLLEQYYDYVQQLGQISAAWSGQPGKGDYEGVEDKKELERARKGYQKGILDVTAQLVEMGVADPVTVAEKPPKDRVGLLLDAAFPESIEATDPNMFPSSALFEPAAFAIDSRAHTITHTPEFRAEFAQRYDGRDSELLMRRAARAMWEYAKRNQITEKAPTDKKGKVDFGMLHATMLSYISWIIPSPAKMDAELHVPGAYEGSPHSKVEGRKAWLKSLSETIVGVSVAPTATEDGQPMSRAELIKFFRERYPDKTEAEVILALQAYDVHVSMNAATEDLVEPGAELAAELVSPEGGMSARLTPAGVTAERKSTEAAKAYAASQAGPVRVVAPGVTARKKKPAAKKREAAAAAAEAEAIEEEAVPEGRAPEWEPDDDEPLEYELVDDPAEAIDPKTVEVEHRFSRRSGGDMTQNPPPVYECLRGESPRVFYVVSIPVGGDYATNPPPRRFISPGAMAAKARMLRNPQQIMPSPFRMMAAMALKQ